MYDARLREKTDAILIEIKKTIETENCNTTEDKTLSTEKDKYCIDYILLLNNGAKVEVLNSEVVREAKSANVKTASDHYPIFIDMKIK